MSDDLNGQRLPCVGIFDRQRTHLALRDQSILEKIHRSDFVLPLGRGQRVAGEGNSSRRNRHAAPVCIHRMISKQAQFDAQGRAPVVFPAP